MEEQVKGLFEQSIDRNSKQIRKDRGNIMIRSSKSFYKGEIDKLYLSLDKLEIDQNNLLDFGGDSTIALISPEKFDAGSFVETDKKIVMDMRELKIRIEEYEKRYQILYGTTYTRDI